MKLVKLNRRHNAHKVSGHNWAFRWDVYDGKSCNQVEKIFRDMYGSQYNWNPLYRGDLGGPWKSNFGYRTRRNDDRRPFWISFKNEQDITAVLLKMENANV